MMHPDSRLIALEICDDFAQAIKKRVPKAEVVCANVRDTDRVLRDRGVEKIDVLISGIPTPSLPPEINKAVLEAVTPRLGDAYFSQLTVMPWVYKAMYERLFADVLWKLVPLNFPPGGVYHCRRLREDFATKLPGMKKKAS